MARAWTGLVTVGMQTRAQARETQEVTGQWPRQRSWKYAAGSCPQEQLPGTGGSTMPCTQPGHHARSEKPSSGRWSLEPHSLAPHLHTWYMPLNATSIYQGRTSEHRYPELPDSSPQIWWCGCNPGRKSPETEPSLKAPTNEPRYTTESRDRGSESWVLAPPLLLISYMTLGDLIYLCGPHL